MDSNLLRLPMLSTPRSASYSPPTSGNQLAPFEHPGTASTEIIMITFGIVGTMITLTGISISCFQNRRSIQRSGTRDEEAAEMPQPSK
jgi:hypothetical protein